MPSSIRKYCGTDPEKWMKRLKTEPEIAGWHIDRLQMQAEENLDFRKEWGTVQPGDSHILDAIAMRFERNVEEIDWLNIDPYEVVLACVSERRRDNFDWTEFEAPRFAHPNPRYPNRHTEAPCPQAASAPSIDF